MEKVFETASHSNEYVKQHVRNQVLRFRNMLRHVALTPPKLFPQDAIEKMAKNAPLKDVPYESPTIADSIQMFLKLKILPPVRACVTLSSRLRYTCIAHAPTHALRKSGLRHKCPL